MHPKIKDLIKSAVINNKINSGFSINKKDVEYCMMSIIGKTKEFLISNPYYKLSRQEEKKILESIKLLDQGIPLAYVIGNQEFYGYKYIVDKHVLIPRPETEIIISRILQQGDSIFKTKKKLTLIDAGSGSGCIGLTVANERPKWNIILTEKSLKSINVLKKNYHEMFHLNCSIIASDWLKGLGQNIADIVVSNPPYIEYDSDHIDNSVYKHEPHSALFSRDKGLYDIKILITESKFVLIKGGLLMIENGFDQSEEVTKILKENYYEDIDIILDYNGIKRFTVSRNL